MYFKRFQFPSVLVLLSGYISWRRILDLICGKNKQKFSRIVRRGKRKKNMYGKCENVINDAVHKVEEGGGQRQRHRWQHGKVVDLGVLGAAGL